MTAEQFISKWAPYEFEACKRFELDLAALIDNKQIEARRQTFAWLSQHLIQLMSTPTGQLQEQCMKGGVAE